MPERKVYKVVFRNHDQLFEIFVRAVSQSSLFGFVEAEEILFGERSQVVVDPSEETIKHEFQGAKRIHIPLHAVVRIDEVEKGGVNRAVKATVDGKVMPFPAPMAPPRRDPGSDG